WPNNEDSRRAIMENWQEPFGDMRQELVFIGQNLDRETIINALDNCLLSDEELLAGQHVWLNLPDPFPVWEAA
ncbi:MAG: GTP-binding protein, partial [Anaerolineales bacterium]|nr:GTP-binding protein [Anaerolineales bacterium]